MHAVSPPQRHAAWSLRIQEAEYSALLPTLARIPTALAYAVAHWRGRFNARFDRDWVSLALGHRHVADLSAAGYAEFHPIASNTTPEGRAINRRADIVLNALPSRTPTAAPARPSIDPGITPVASKGGTTP